MSDAYEEIISKREIYSKERLDELRKKIDALEEIKKFTDLTIFGAGSYARLEASEYSDLDLFFLHSGSANDVDEPRTSQILLFARIIDIAKEMHFPKFTNDGDYLQLLFIGNIIDKLGGPSDDYCNHFTTRMLLLLESKCIYNEDMYNKAIEKIVDSYFRDYFDHKRTYRPIFLLNDIIRYWKTLLLNYENKRNQPTQDEIKRTKQKVKNFKLKFSRMTTCFATLALLSCYKEPVKPKDVVELVRLTPRSRLLKILECMPETKDVINRLFLQYSEFLSMTGLPEEELLDHFSDKTRLIDLFGKANRYGDTMFELLSIADSHVNAKELKILRYLVI